MAARGATDWDAVPLGSLPDAELARLHGVTRQAVAQQRARRGIPPAGPAVAPLLSREDLGALESALAQLLDSDVVVLRLATATAVPLVRGWAVEMRRSANNRLVRVRFRSAIGRGWSEWMTPRRARSWLLQAGWADAAVQRIDELRARPEEATA